MCNCSVFCVGRQVGCFMLLCVGSHVWSCRIMCVGAMCVYSWYILWETVVDFRGIMCGETGMNF